jgi:hypothetical protein
VDEGELALPRVPVQAGLLRLSREGRRRGTTLAPVPRYRLELHWPEDQTTIADYDSGEVVYEEGDTLQDDRHPVIWRIERIEPEPEPFLARLVCHVEPEAG